ncbi:hypothetical protein LCGC14_1385560 [marine sediment metagenome]|uniref:Uncharacterized protein n=1 Tax=marine sediment metagenome TaxID=412755 RepID=A0A0F9KMC6_9ZZZZ
MSDPDMDREMNAGYGRTTSWNKLLAEEMECNGEALVDVVELERHPGSKPCDFYFAAWSLYYVYAAWSPGGDEEVISLPRNPA